VLGAKAYVALEPGVLEGSHVFMSAESAAQYRDEAFGSLQLFHDSTAAGGISPTTLSNGVQTGVTMKAPSTTIRLAPHVEREVSVKASVDPRTVRRVLNGEPTLAMPRGRVIKALRELGLDQYVPAEAGDDGKAVG